MKTRQENLYDCITYYAIENWDNLVKKATHWQKGDHCIPISDQLMQKFKCDYSTASRIARDVANLKNCGIV